jgi:hypothetical protein
VTSSVSALLECLVCAVFVWGLMLWWARKEISAVRRQAKLAAGYWQRQAELAKRQVARLAREAELRDRAWQRGRDDVIAIVPLIEAVRKPPETTEEGAA